MPLRLEPGRSVQLAGGLLVVHITAMLTVPWLPISATVQLPLGLALAGSLLWYWLQDVLRVLPCSIHHLTWQHEAECRVTLASGVTLPARPGSRAFVQPWLVIFPYRTGRWHNRYLLLLPDMLDTATFRRLRVRLRTRTV